MAGYVYVIENENHKVKIGRSIDPEKRIKHIEKISGYKVVNIYVTPCLHQYIQLETFLHGHFATNRSIGEWFNISYYDAVSYVSSLKFDEWNIEPPYKEPPDYDRLIRQMILGPLLKTINEPKQETENIIESKIYKLSKLIDRKESITKKYIESLYDQIDTLQSKLIYIEEQGITVKFPDLPQFDEDAVILAREDIIEEYDSIE